MPSFTFWKYSINSFESAWETSGWIATLLSPFDSAWDWRTSTNASSGNHSYVPWDFQECGVERLRHPTNACGTWFRKGSLALESSRCHRGWWWGCSRSPSQDSCCLFEMWFWRLCCIHTKPRAIEHRERMKNHTSVLLSLSAFEMSWTFRHSRLEWIMNFFASYGTDERQEIN